MDKIMLKLTERGEHIYIRAECCLQHAWASTSCQVRIANNIAVVEVSTEHITSLEPSEALFLSKQISYIGIVAEVINEQLQEKTLSNIQTFLTIDVVERRLSTTRELSDEAQRNEPEASDAASGQPLAQRAAIAVRVE